MTDDTPDLSMIAPDLRPLAHPLSRYDRWQGNPKRHAEDVLRDSYREHGQLKPLVAWLGDDITAPLERPVLIAGNGFADAMIAAGATHAAVVERHMPFEQARRFVLIDNRSPQLGGFDDEALAELLAEIQRDDPELSNTGYTPDDLERLLNRMSGAGDVTADEANADAMVTCPQCGHTFEMAAVVSTRRRRRKAAADDEEGEPA